MIGTHPTARRALRYIVRDHARRAFAPPPNWTVSQWADNRRVISSRSGAVEPGQWRTSRVPYLREIMDSLSEPGVDRVVFMKSSQVGGTEVGLNWIGSTMDQDPAPMLALWPTETMFKNWSNLLLDPLLQDTPCLRNRVVDVEGRRDSRNTMQRKTFPGGYLVALSAKSSGQLRSLRAPRALAEEVDEYEPDIRAQGDPIALLERGLRTFWRAGLGKLYINGTPTVAGVSRIESEFNKSDQRYYMVPCPHCEEEQDLVWKDDDGRYRLICERTPKGQLDPSTARYLCEHCVALIDETERDAMLSAGRWVATNPESRIRGYHVNTLYSPLVSWEAVMTEFLKSRKSAESLKTFVNLWLGLPFQEDAESVLDPEVLKNRRTPYGAVVPFEAGLLTAAVDVQGDWLDVLVWGWGALEQSWIIEWMQIDGDPGQDDVWDELTKVLKKDWLHQGGATLRIAAMAVDARYNSDRVHAFCDRHEHVIPTTGKDGRGRPIITSPAAMRRKRSRVHRRPSWMVGVDSGKDKIAAMLRVVEPGPQYIHFPENLDEVFFDQLTAEQLRTVYIHGRPVRKWTAIKNRRNEALDLAVLNLAALAFLGSKVTASLGDIVTRVQQSGPSGTSAPKPTAPRQRRMLSKGVE